MSATEETTGTEIDVVDRDEIAIAEQARRERKPIPAQNGLLAPARWEMFGRIANTVANTEFVPKALRGNPPAVMACLLYGDAQGLHPSVALTEVYIVDGKPSMSATLMVGKIRMAKVDGVRVGHKLRREEIRDKDGVFKGVTAHGERGDDGETDSFTFTLEMAGRAGLLSKDNWKKYPEAMCWARCVSQLARMLFPDVFLGQSAYTSEELGLEDTTDDGVPEADALPEGAGGNGAAAADYPPPEEQKVVYRIRDEASDEPGPALEAMPDGTERVGYEIDTEANLKTVFLREIPAEVEIVDEGGEPAGAPEPAEDAVTEDQPPEEPAAADEPAGDAAEGARADALRALKDEAIPRVLAAVTGARDRGDRDFVLGVLDHEKSKARPRVRLVESLEDVLAGMDVDAGRPAEPEPEPEPELPPREYDVSGGGFTPIDPDADVVETSVSEATLIVKLKAACAWMQDQMPQDRRWRYESVIAAAGKQFNRSVHTFDDLEQEELEAIWEAVPEPAKSALALVDPNALTKLADQAI